MTNPSVEDEVYDVDVATGPPVENEEGKQDDDED